MGANRVVAKPLTCGEISLLLQEVGQILTQEGFSFGFHNDPNPRTPGKEPEPEKEPEGEPEEVLTSEHRVSN